MDETPLFDEGGLLFNPDNHQLMDCLWAASLRNSLSDPDLFLYFNKRHQSFVLAKWTKPPSPEFPGLMVEFFVFPSNPDSLDMKFLPSTDEVRHKLRIEQEVMKEIVKTEKERRERTKHLKEMAAIHRNDVVKFMKKKAGPVQEDNPKITGILTGRVPWTTKELLEEQAGRKIL